MKKYIKNIKNIKKLVALKKQLFWRKIKLSANPKQVDLRNNVSSPWNKM